MSDTLLFKRYKNACPQKARSLHKNKQDNDKCYNLFILCFRSIDGVAVQRYQEFFRCTDIYCVLWKMEQEFAPWGREGRLCRQKKALYAKPWKYQHSRVLGNWREYLWTRLRWSKESVQRLGCRLWKMLGDHAIVQFIRITSESLFLNEIAKPQLGFTESESLGVESR